MTVSELQDLVRTKCGVPGLDPFQLRTFCRWGRRELESRGNFYYALASAPKDFALADGTQTYGITVSGAGNLNLPLFKEAHSMFIRGTSTAQDWSFLPVGAWEGSVDFPNTTKAKPQIAVVNNDTLYFFAVPDAAYNVRLIYFNWTEMPTDVTDTDELLTNWDQALFYATMMAAKRFLEQSMAAGDAWEVMLKDQVEKLKDFTNKRLKDPINTMSTREAAQILQASGAAQ